MVSAAWSEHDMDRVRDLQRRFGFNKVLAIRAEHAFYHALVKLVPELALLIRALDKSVLSAMAGKAKSVGDLRPDYFHVMHTPTGLMGLHGEYDEDSKHEKCAERLKCIARAADCEDRVYVFRVNGHHDNRELALARRKTTKNGAVYYQLTTRGYAVVEQVARYVRECLEDMRRGLPPNEVIREF